MSKVAGYCPMGCGTTLFLSPHGGHVTCSWHRCPNPGAVDAILAEDESEHIVTIGLDSFTVRHPLRERADDHGHTMETCSVHQTIASLNGPPARPGVYRVRIMADGLAWGQR